MSTLRNILSLNPAYLYQLHSLPAQYSLGSETVKRRASTHLKRVHSIPVKMWEKFLTTRPSTDLHWGNTPLTPQSSSFKGSQCVCKVSILSYLSDSASYIHEKDKGYFCSSQPSIVHWLSSPIFPCSFVRSFGCPAMVTPVEISLLVAPHPQTHTFSESLW